MLSLWYVNSKFFISIFFFSTSHEHILNTCSIKFEFNGTWIPFKVIVVGIHVVLINVTIFKKERNTSSRVVCVMIPNAYQVYTQFFLCRFTFFQHYINISHNHIILNSCVFNSHFEFIFQTSCSVSDFAAFGHNPPLVVPGLCARCPLHSSRDSSYELGIFPHRFPWHASDVQGKAVSRPLAADTWQEQQQTCSRGRSSIHLFSQNIIGSHLFFSCIGLLHHSSHLLHFSILWNGIPNQDCGTHTQQQRARCHQHSQASGRRRFSNLSGRYHLLWTIFTMLLITLCRVYRSNHSCSHE